MAAMVSAVSDPVLFQILPASCLAGLDVSLTAQSGPLGGSIEVTASHESDPLAAGELSLISPAFGFGYGAATVTHRVETAGTSNEMIVGPYTPSIFLSAPQWSFSHDGGALVLSETVSIVHPSVDIPDDPPPTMVYAATRVNSAIPEPSAIIVWSVLALLGIGAGWWRRSSASGRL